MTATYQPEIPEKYVERLFELNEKVAIVTGGASGLGEAIALGFSQAGAHVVIADVDAVRTNALLEAVSNYRSPPTFIECDVTDKSSVDHLTHETLAAFGQIDVLVNSAGMAFRSVAEDFPEEMYDQIIDLNLKGTFIPCQVVGKSMLKARSGSIINLASIGASRAYPEATAYLQSKGGVAQMTRSLALEWIDRNVRVNALAPSIFDTPLVRAADKVRTRTSDFIMERTPIGRRGLTKEIVGPAIFLASDAASMVTGHILQVDGGYLVA